MSDECCKCKKIVRPRQEAICCSTCERWTHRTCGTGISRQLYRQLVRDGGDVEWWCDDCGVPAGVEPDNPSDVSIDESLISSAHSPPKAASIPAPRTAPIPAPRTAPIPAPRTAPIPAPRTAPIPAPRRQRSATPETPKGATGRTMSTSTPEGLFHVSFNVSNVSMEPVEIHEESNIDEVPAMDVSVVDDVPVTYQIVEGGTKRGGRMLVSSDGYSYTLKKTSRTSTSWRCSVRSTSLWCRASVAQHGDDFRFGQVAHVHAPNPGLLTNVKVRAIVKEQARVHAYRSAGALTEDVMAEEFTPGDFNLPNPAYIQRAANRVREKLRPKEPTDLDFEIDTEFLGCDDFLMGDLRVDGERHIIFGTPLQHDLLRRAKRWYLDGTFKIVRRPFVQLYTIHAFIQQDDTVKQVPLVYILMSRMRKIDYLAVFRRINEVLGIGINVRSIVVDFEAAVWSAVKTVYPEVDITGCYFHWAQAVMRKVQSLGLKTTYCQKKGLYVFVQQLLGLPYLPSGHIQKAFENLTRKLPCPEVEELTTYLDATWMRSPHWHVRQWSVFRQSIRTNNDCEGWHRRFNGKAGRAMLHFYLLVPLLRKESNTVEVTMRLVEEQVVTRHRRARNRAREMKVERLWEDYEEQKIRTSAFLRAVSRICAPGFPE